MGPDPEAEERPDAADETEEEFLARYRAGRDAYPKAANTADVALLAGGGAGLSLLLIRRGGHPYRGSWALPGGFVDLGDRADSGEGEDLEACAVRELVEECGIRLPAHELAQLGTYSAPDRDPRGRTISTVFIAHPAQPGAVDGGDDAAEARWWPVRMLESPDGPELAFDHARIVSDVLAWADRQGLR